MLIGRRAELDAIDDLLARAKAGSPAVLRLVGAPGIGKTALLDAAAERAEHEGMRVVRLLALELEAGLPAAALGVLLPLLGHDPKASSAALLAALSHAASDGPLLLLIDDAQWLDEESRIALSFATRRLFVDAVAVLLGCRPGCNALPGLADMPRLEVPPLDEAEGAALLQTLRPGMPVWTARAVSAGLGGIPLALVEAPALLDPAVLRGQAPVPSPLPVGEAVRLRYARGLDELSGEARSSVVLLAADDTGDPTVLGEAAQLGAGPGGADVAAAWEAAERVGLVRLSPTPTFVHPLARAAVHSHARPEELRAAHRALATVHDRRGDAYGAVRHAAQGAVPPDPELSARLEDLARQLARTRLGRVEVPALALRAADFASTVADRERCLLLAAEASPPERSAPLARSLASGSADADVRARCVLIQVENDESLSPAQRLELLATIHADAAPDVLLRREAAEVWAEMERADVDRLVERVTRANLLDGHGSWARSAMLGSALRFVGDNQRSTLLLQQALDSSRGVDPAGLGIDELVSWATIPGWLGGVHDELSARIRRMEDLLRSTGRPIEVGVGAFFRAELAYLEGNWRHAEALFVETIELRRALGAASPVERARLACLRAYRGQVDAARTEAQAAREEFEGAQTPWHSLWVDQALGALALSLGRHEEAVELLQPCAQARFLGRGARDAVVTGLVDLAEASAACNDGAGLAQTAATLQRWLEGSTDPLALALLARVHALAVPADADRLLPHALDHLGQTVEVFQTARTELLLGQHLRRSRRPREARAPLRRAVEVFDRLDARTWAERARRELEAAGERPTTASEPVSLTPQELRVAEAVGDGLSNAEVAAALFLSVKTVEFHLSRVYRKLGVRSRGGLARALRQHVPAVSHA